MKPKILIIGGGIGGLSCATALAETGKFDISVYESDILGGQASSKKSKLCNTEISWRIVGESYNNLNKLLIETNIIKNFYSLKKDDTCINNKDIEPLNNPIRSIIKNCNIKEIARIINIIFLSKARAINEYHNVKANNYYYNSLLMNIILGPYFGLEAKKITLSSFYKNLFGVKNPNLFVNNVHISKYPTSDSLFNPWRKYLESRGVKIYEKHSLQDIITDKNGKIKKVVINNKQYIGDEMVIACSIKPLHEIFNRNKELSIKPITNKLNILNTGHQFYISVNFYWKRPIIKSSRCHIYTFTNGWMPIIIKRFINTNYVKENCNNEIKEVWNIGLADYFIGNYVKKYTSQCSFKEMVYEVKMNIMNSQHFKNYFDFDNNTWDDYFYDYEFDDRYYKKLPSTIKFSINKGIEANLLNNIEPQLGDNIYFSAYYVKNYTGGASMETSCEIGLTTADLICKKYKVFNPRKPVYKTQNYITALTLPLVKLDELLYKLKLPPITDYINPILLLILYFIIIVIILYYLIVFIRKKNKCKKLRKRKKY